jgi:Icc protein
MRDPSSPLSRKHRGLPTGNAAGSLRVLQITDTHLYADTQRCLLGLNTEESIAEILRQVAEHAGDFDLVLATGDLVHDGTAEAYRRIGRHFAALERPVYCLPGNHDDPAVMARVIGDGAVRLTSHALHGRWLFVLLDSTVAGSEGGHLSAPQLALLEERLTTHSDRHALVCLHHQPVPVGSVWMDGMALDNAADFFAVLDHHPQVRGVLWGHVHQAFEATRNGVRLLGSPSTCIQFTPGQAHFGVDRQPPGYRWLLLHPDGRIETGVERLVTLPEGIDLDSAGY